MDREAIKKVSRIVIKLGSSILTNDGTGLDQNFINSICHQVSQMQDLGKEIVIVSSGAIAEGMLRLGLNLNSRKIDQLQTAAAVGQTGLMNCYDRCFRNYDRKTAQILIDHDDFANRKRYLNARNLIKNLISLGVIPIINENDSVSTEEIRFGDNDSLAALIANLIDADVLFLLTDRDGLYSADPTHDNDARLISSIAIEDKKIEKYAGGAGLLGRGGMISKIKAAKIAANSGCETLIAGGRVDNVIQRVMDCEELGTFLYSNQKPLNARKQWLLGQLKHSGCLVIDSGAVEAVKEKNFSLLPIGITKVFGSFIRGELVKCVDKNDCEVARGLVNYDSSETRLIAGAASSEIVNILGYQENDTIIDKDNLIAID